MSEQTLRLVERLRARLHRTVRRMTWADTAFGAAVALGTLAAVWFALVAVEAGLWLGTTPRTALAVLVAAVTLGVIGVYLARPLGQLLGLVDPPSEEEVARSIGQKYPEVSDRLVNLLQLAAGRRSSAPEPMVDRAVERLGSEVEEVPFEEVEDFDRARKALRLASLPVVGILAFLLVAPSTFLGASERLLTPTTHYQRPAPFQLSVTPGHTQLVKGDSLRVDVRAEGEAPPTVTLALQTDGETGTETISLQADSTGHYHHTVSGLRSSLRYRVEARPVSTAWYTAEVRARPLVRTLQVTLTPPAYTGLPERTLDPNVGDVTGLPGTQVSIEAGIGGPPVDSAAVAFDDGSAQPLTIEDDAAQGTFTLSREGRYRLYLRSDNGISNRDPIRYQLSLRADARPSVAFLAPEPSATLQEDLATELRLRLSDDFGFAQLKLYYRLAEQRFGEGQTEFQSIELPLKNPRAVDQEVVHTWLLAQDSGLDLVPGDVVEYYVKVWDNDAVAGYKSATTQTQTLRLPSLAEQYDQLDQEQSAAEEQMQDLKEQSESIDRQFDTLRDELRRKQSADWEDRRQLDQIQQKQKQVQDGVEELSRQMEELTRQMQQESLTSPETAQKYEELQRVIEEINSPELQKALENLRQSMENMDLRQMQQAMENFEFNEEQYRERLERSLELFKQIKAQQKLEEMSKRLGNLSKLEEQLAEETQKRADPEEAKGEEPEANGEEEPSESEAEAESTDDATESGDSESGDTPSDEQASDEQASEEQPSEQQTSGEQDGNPQDGNPQTGEQPPQDQDPAQSPEDAEQTPSEPGANEDLAKEQQRAAEEMRKIMDEMQKLSDEMQDVRSAPTQQMQQMQQQMQQQNLPQQMQENSQQLRQNQLQEAREGQQRMQQQLQQMQQQMQKMQQGMQGQQQQINMAGLRSALENTLRLSQDQEALRGTVNELSADSPTLRTYAQEQQDLVSGLETVSDSLQSLARNVPQMSRAVQKETGDALREMKSATSALSERSAGRATGHQKGSMMHLNELALLLSDLMDQMQSGSGSGSGMSMQQMLQQMQQMSGDQQKLNQQLQQFLNDVQGNRLSVDQKERLKQLSRKQQQIKKELENLGQGSGLRDDLLGDLNKIAEQMEETIRELQQGSQNRRTLERQRQILTRMLQAQKSLRTQGKKKERQGSTSEDEFDRTPPDELSPQQEAEKLRRDLIRALESGYAPDYEELIKRYFELLQQQNPSRPGGPNRPSSPNE